MQSIFPPLNEVELLHISGGMRKTQYKSTDQHTGSQFDLAGFGGAVAAGAVTGGLAAAAVTGGPGAPLGAVGGALLGGIGHCSAALVNPPARENTSASFQPTMAVCHQQR